MAHFANSMYSILRVCWETVPYHLKSGLYHICEVCWSLNRSWLYSRDSRALIFPFELTPVNHLTPRLKKRCVHQIWIHHNKSTRCFPVRTLSSGSGVSVKAGYGNSSGHGVNGGWEKDSALPRRIIAPLPDQLCWIALYTVLEAAVILSEISHFAQSPAVSADLLLGTRLNLPRD